eukprot:2985626-Heterocapsa_arctica.AAC.1
MHKKLSNDKQTGKDYQKRNRKCNILYQYRSHFGSNLIRTGGANLPKNRDHGGLKIGGRECDGTTGQLGLPRRGNEKGAQKKEQRDLGDQYR